jgi:hypothetical protein
MKKQIILWALLLISSHRLLAQDEVGLVSQLYYGNPGQDMRAMCFLAEGWAIGVGQANDWLYLLSPQGHLADSLDLQTISNTRGFGRFVSRLQPAAPNLAIIVCATSNVLVAQKGGKLQVLGLWQAYRVENGKPTSDGTYRLGNWLAGYQREKTKKTGMAGQDHRNFPLFWMRKLVSRPRTFGEQISINPPMVAVTGDLYYNWQDNHQVQNYTQVHAQAVSVFGGKFYFNVTRANRCYVRHLDPKGKLSRVSIRKPQAKPFLLF